MQGYIHKVLAPRKRGAKTPCRAPAPGFRPHRQRGHQLEDWNCTAPPMLSWFTEGWQPIRGLGLGSLNLSYGWSFNSNGRTLGPSQPLQEIPNLALGLTAQPPVVLGRGRCVGAVPRDPPMGPSPGA